MHRRAFLVRAVLCLSVLAVLRPAASAQVPAATIRQAPTGDSIPIAAPPLPTGIARQELFGTAVRQSKWKRNPIEVCWLQTPASEAALRDLVKRAVAETWEKHSKVRFAGWSICSNTLIGIRIQVLDENEPPHVMWIGRFTDGRNPGMVLNFTFTQWRQQCQQTRDFCVYAIAAHEFGHALGFTHEQDRPETPDWCKERDPGAVGDYKVTDYDPSSIMNYCNEKWMGDGRLSALDVEAVQTVYGRS